MNDKGPAWVRMRLQVLLVSSLFIAGGAVLIIMGAIGMMLASITVGVVLVVIGTVMIAIRPWTYLQRLEVQAASYKEGLSAPRASRRTYGPADAHWHHEGEDGHSPGICEGCGMLLGPDGRCRRCDEGQD